ncbi:MAG: NAD-dependent epimerase/dehydratase family protein [Myxococcales bacterium]|nr:NAD-dependent epimerase/dehydratase family protein [Myxococcales bacterium]
MSASSERTIAVLGAGGFLGSHLVEGILEKTGHRVIAVDRTLRKLAVRSPRLTLLESALGEPGLLRKVVAESEVVVSMTALCNPALYNTRPVEVIHASFTDLVPLVDLCTSAHRRLVHLSTCEVYGRPPDAEQALSEDSPSVFGPVEKERWTYAAAKLLLERYIYARGRHHGLAYTIVRPFNVIGPRMDFIRGIDGDGTPRVLASFLGALLAGEPLELVDGGQRRRAFLWVGELVEALLRILAEPARCEGQTFNLGNPRNEVTIAELARQLSALFAARQGTARAPARSVPAERFYGEGYDDVEARVPAIEKAKRLLGWEPRRTLEEMLPEIVEDYLARYGERARAARQ